MRQQFVAALGLKSGALPAEHLSCHPNHAGADRAAGAHISWALSCEKKSGGMAKTSGHLSLSLPGSTTPALPAPSSRCTVTVAAQLDGSGHILVSVVSPHQTS